MRKIELNRNSWHYKIASFTPGFSSWRYNANICNYPWRILYGLICFAIAAIITFVLSCIIADTFAWIAACLVDWIWIDPAGYLSMIGFTLITLGGLILTMFGTMFSVQFLIEIYTHSDNFIIKAYAAHKEKYCAKIEFVNK